MNNSLYLLSVVKRSNKKKMQVSLQSHDTSPTDNAILQDVIGSPTWKEAYSAHGFFKAEACGISAQLSTDGMNPFSSNKVVYLMWPIMLTILNLPKGIRNYPGLNKVFLSTGANALQGCMRCDMRGKLVMILFYFLLSDRITT